MSMTNFTFTSDNLTLAKAAIKKYPEGRQKSAVLPLLQLAQKQNDNWLPKTAMEAVAMMLEMPFMKVYEVASFYSMFNLAPVGTHLLQVCTTTPCWLCGSSEVVKICLDRLGIKPGETTKDGKFTLKEVECLGACTNAPVVQINDDYYENLNARKMADVLDKLGGDTC